MKNIRNELNNFNIIEDMDNNNLLIIYKYNFVDKLKENNINVFIETKEYLIHFILIKQGKVIDRDFIDINKETNKNIIIKYKNIFITDEKSKNIICLKFNHKILSPSFNKYLPLDDNTINYK